MFYEIPMYFFVLFPYYANLPYSRILPSCFKMSCSAVSLSVAFSLILASHSYKLFNISSKVRVDKPFISASGIHSSHLFSIANKRVYGK